MRDTAPGPDSTLAERLKWAREAVDEGLSAREVDRVAGLHHGHTWAIESGARTNIESATSLALARVFGVSLDWLLTGSGSVPIMSSVASAFERARSEQDRVSATGSER